MADSSARSVAKSPSPKPILRSLDIAPGSSFLGFHDVGPLVTVDGHDGYFVDGVGSFDRPVSALHVLRLVENAHSLGRVATVRLALLSAGVGVRLAGGGAAEPPPFSMPEWPTFGSPVSDAPCAGGWLAPAPPPAELVRPPEPMASGASARSAGATSSSGSSAPAPTPPGNPEVAAVLDALEAWKLTAACSIGLAPLRPRALVRAPLDKLAARQYAIASMVLESRPRPDPNDLVALRECLAAHSVWRRAAGSPLDRERAQAVARGAPPSLVPPDVVSQWQGAKESFEDFCAAFPADMEEPEPLKRCSPLTIDELWSSPTLRAALRSRDVGELCAGVGSLSSAHRTAGARPRVLIERLASDRAYLDVAFRDSVTYGDFFDFSWANDGADSLAAVYGGISCVFFSSAGRQLGASDPRAAISTYALPAMARRFRSPFMTFENVPGIATANGGSGLAAIDANAAASNYVRTPRVEGVDGGLELVRPNLHGAPGVRDRAIGHYELDGLEELVGPCPPLELADSAPLVINDILDVGPRDPALIVDGLLEPVAVDLSNTRFPVSAGFVSLGGEGVPIFVGSRVSCRRLDAFGPGDWVVLDWSLVTLFVFDDSRRDPRWKSIPLNVPSDPVIHLVKRFRVLDPRGTAATSTEKGVPPLGCAKQFWYVRGQIVSPSAAELWRVQEYDVATMGPYAVAALPHLAAERTDLPMQLRSLPGKGINARVAAAVARRTLRRASLLAAVLDGTVERFDSSLEHTLGAALAAFAPSDQATMVFVVAVAWVDSRPLVLVSRCGARLPSASTPLDSPRKSAIMQAERLMAAACPGRRPQAVMVADLKWARLVAVPVAFHSPVQASFGDVVWRSVTDLSEPLAAPCARSVATVASMISRAAAKLMPPPVLPGGARAPAFVPQAPAELAADAARWALQVADGKAACAALRARLVDLADTHEDGAYFAGWADQVGSFGEEEVPPQLRGHALDYDDVAYASTPFAYRDSVPTTLPAPIPPQQATDYEPRNLCPDIFSPALMARWNEWWPKVLADLRQYAAHGEGAQRTFNEPFIAASSELNPLALGVVWDVRHLGPGGFYLPVDYSTRLRQRQPDTEDDPTVISTHLGVEFILRSLANYADQEMVSMICRTGVDFLVDAGARQLAVFPHLVSLPEGFTSVESELLRLNKLKFNEFCSSFPFVPLQALPQGSTSRVHEPTRKRRTTEAGAPRKKRGKWTADADDRDVLPLNDDIGTKTLVADPPWRLPGLPTTTGFLSYDEAVAAHSTAPAPRNTRWAPEIKVRLEDQLHNTAVLKYASTVYGEPVFVLTADAKDFFNQLMLAPWCRHCVGLLWRPLSDEHADFTFVVEHSLGFGISMASNIAQRFAYGLMDLFYRVFDAIDAPFLAADRTIPRRAAWLRSREALSKRTGRNEVRLASALMYTDDPSFLVVGVERAVRLLVVWRWIARHTNLTMAIAAKHAIGARAKWLGLLHLPTMGVCVVPLDKLMRTLVSLDWLATGNQLAVRDYESLLGMLEHLLAWANGQRSSMFGLYAPLKRASPAGPATMVAVTEDSAASFAAWATRLRGRAGVPASAVFARSAFLAAAPAGVEMIISTDAAKDGTETPGLGGYCHGLRFRVPLQKADVTGPFEIPIAVLEFIGIVVAIIVFGPHIAAAADVITVASDSLTSVDAVLNDSSHADLMQLVHSYLLASDEYAQVRRVLRLGHIYGEGNPWADAESRGHDHVLESLREQLGVSPLSPAVPAHATALLERVRSAVRNRPPSLDELSVTKKFRGGITGDGPSSCAHLALPVAVAGASFAALTARAALRAVPSVPPAEARSPGPVRPSPATPAAAGCGLGAGGVPGASYVSLTSAASAAVAPDSSAAHCARPSQAPAAALGKRAAPCGPAQSDRFAHLALPSAVPGSSFSALLGSPLPRAELGGGGAPVPSGHASARDAPTGTSAASHSRVYAPARSQAAKRLRMTTSALRGQSLASSLANDESEFALRPRDPEAFDRLVADMGELLEEATPVNTLSKDSTAWARWEDLCRDFGTSAWRPSSENLSFDELRRERFLFNAYNVNEYRVNIKPRGGNAAPKPASAMNNTLAVKRVLKRGGISPVATPELTVLLKGMLRQYIRLHGPESLIPKRAEPLTNADTLAILRLPSGTTLANGKTLNWAQPFWRSFRAFLTSARAAAFRKADVLPVTRDEFDMGSASRANLSWFFKGEYRSELTVEELSSLTMADRAVLRPPPVKNDPFSESFGAHPIHLPFDPDDELNAARWLADLELGSPVYGSERRRVPLFPSGPVAATPLTHGPADSAFRAIVKAALPAERAAMLTLHSMRVFAACALLAQGASPALIMALCRWKCEQSLRIYARLRPEDYVHWVRRMRTSNVTTLTARNIPEMDNHAVARAMADI